jgi:hypothetical protein
MKPVFLWLNKIMKYRATKTDPNLPLPRRAPSTKSSRRRHLLSLTGSRHDLALIDSYLYVELVETLSFNSLGFFIAP